MCARQLSERFYRTGQLIFAEDDEATEAFVVKEGSVEIFRKQGTLRAHLANVEPGGFFGEMALISNEPRSASAIALVDTVCLVVDDDMFNEQLGKCPKFIQGMVRILTGYVRNATDRLFFLEKFHNMERLRRRKDE